MPTPIEPLATVLEHLIALAVAANTGDGYWLDQATHYTQPIARDQQIVIRVSVVEKLELQRLSEEAGQTMSDYARMRIFS